MPSSAETAPRRPCVVYCATVVAEVFSKQRGRLAPRRHVLGMSFDPSSCFFAEHVSIAGSDDQELDSVIQ